MEKAFIISNNPLVWDKYPSSTQLHTELAKGYKEILIFARDFIHRGSKIINHPLAGSVKPNETPFKSLILTFPQIGVLDLDSLRIIEGSIQVYEKFSPLRRNWHESVYDDFQFIDWALLLSAVEALPATIRLFNYLEK